MCFDSLKQSHSWKIQYERTQTLIVLFQCFDICLDFFLFLIVLILTSQNDSRSVRATITTFSKISVWVSVYFIYMISLYQSINIIIEIKVRCNWILSNFINRLKWMVSRADQHMSSKFKNLTRSQNKEGLFDWSFAKKKISINIKAWKWIWLPLSVLHYGMNPLYLRWFVFSKTENENQTMRTFFAPHVLGMHALKFL